MLYLLGKSTNLLSLGAVDFGIIVDSSVIMVESDLSPAEHGRGRRFADRRSGSCKSSGEVERSLFFSRVIIICALLPLFTMSGPEGQIFGPMADAYAFALAGALLFALTLSPVLCRIYDGEDQTRARQLSGARAETVLHVAAGTAACDYRWAGAGRLRGPDRR